MFVFVSGSSGSGKSLYAENKLIALSENTSPGIYIATAKIYDEEMKARVIKHQAMRRGKNFITIEKSSNLGEIRGLDNACVLIEDLASWTANEMFDGYMTVPPPLVSMKIQQDLTKILERARHVVLVSCEIFSDEQTYDNLTESYIKTLAMLHIRFASFADEVTEIISGLSIHYNI